MAKILIIDDEDPIRRLLRTALERDGHEVRDAGDGRDGLRMHGEDPADLVITDLVMPDQEGMETIRGVRAVTPHVPVVAISGGGRGDAGGYLKVAELIGASASLQKPFTLPEIRRVVSDLVGSQPT